MARNLLVVAKVCPGVDAELDSILSRMQGARDLLALTDDSQPGRGLLYWTCWYDSWLMGNDLTPDGWMVPLKSRSVAPEIWELSLTEGDWPAVEQMARGRPQWSEQRWLPWQLWEASQSYSVWNHRAQLLIGREAIGPSLSGAEVLGENPA